MLYLEDNQNSLLIASCIIKYKCNIYPMNFVLYFFLKDDRWSFFKVKRFFCNAVIYSPSGLKETKNLLI